jgi:uncharacterized membrane protein
VTPAQLGWLFVVLALASLGIATYFWHLGAYLVLPFAVIEVVVLGIAFVVHARHATDGERIQMRDGRLVVEHERAGHLERVEFDPAWVRVEPVRNDGSLVEVSGQGRRVWVGQFLRPHLRTVLAHELRAAIRGRSVPVGG